MSERIGKMLALLGDANTRLINIEVSEERAIKSVMPEEVQLEIQAIKEEFQPAKESVQDEIKRIRSEINDSIKEHGETVKGEFFQGIFIKPKRKWNGEKLEGLFLAKPELNIDDYSEMPAPRAQIREVKKFSMER